MADATYGAKQAPSPDTLFRTDLKAGAHTPYHKDEDRAALLAAIPAATSNLATQATLAAVLSTLQAQMDLSTTLWTDNSGAFYVRRDIIDQDSGTVTVTFTTPTGTAATPGAGLRPVANEESLHTETIRYVSNVSGTGHTAGDMLERVVVIDANASPPTVVSSAWVNLTTGAVMGTAPTIANLTANPTALPANAATETTAAAILAKLIAAPATAALQSTANGYLATIATAAGDTAPTITVDEAPSYLDIAASQTNVAVGNANDLLDSLLITPATMDPGAVTIGDGATATVVKFAGGTGSVSTLIPFPIDMKNIAAVTNHRVTTGANVSVRAFYRPRT